ncbi:CDP-alcohol phosphatidyltransferase family protein [candidate division KSB1 bacterium]|nr:CDP-alcohol phosphatidyltransferase family protein [candidate division KSB1 bacterium]
MNILPQWTRGWYVNLIQPVINLFIKYKLNPNWFTTLGLIISFVAAYFFGIGNHRLGGALFLLAGTLDIIDGKVARSSGRVTKFGAIYDSTLDRYAEMLVFFGIIYYYSQLDSEWLWGVDISLLGAISASIGVAGSIMVSYVRARAEGLGLECKVGMLQRPERIVYLGFGAIFHRYIMLFVLLMIAILANLTTIQRLLHVRRQTLASTPEQSD